jgi:cytoskeletal protein RodZ
METPETVTPKKATGFGRALTEAREAAGVDMRWVSDTTKIQMRYLEALENEEWSTLPGGMIGRGFVRIIVQELGADTEKLLALYAAVRGVEAPNPMKPPHDTDWRVGPTRPVINPKLIAAIATLLVCIGVLMWLWRPWEDEVITTAVAGSDNTMHALEIRALEQTWLTVKARDAKMERFELAPAAIINLKVITPVTLKSDNAAALQLSWDGIALKPLGKQGQELDLVLPEGLAELRP